MPRAAASLLEAASGFFPPTGAFCSVAGMPRGILLAPSSQIPAVYVNLVTCTWDSRDHGTAGERQTFRPLGGAAWARIILLFPDKPWQPGCGGKRERAKEQSQEEKEALLVRRRVLGGKRPCQVQARTHAHDL